MLPSGVVYIYIFFLFSAFFGGGLVTVGRRVLASCRTGRGEIDKRNGGAVTEARGRGKEGWVGWLER